MTHRFLMHTECLCGSINRRETQVYAYNLQTPQQANSVPSSQSANSASCFATARPLGLDRAVDADCFFTAVGSRSGIEFRHTLHGEFKWHRNIFFGRDQIAHRKI